MVYGDLVWDHLDRKLVRVVRKEGLSVVVMDRDTLKELPDYRHETQVEKPSTALFSRLVQSCT
jgi:hypothetical protein